MTDMFIFIGSTPFQVGIFIFGAMVGSFLNVCISRLPQGESIIHPRSHCRHCKKTIPWFDNIPLISYFVLKGRCRYCRQKFSLRYVLVEFLMAVTFVIFYRYFCPSILLVPYLIMVSCFMVAIFTDFEHRMIPDEISVGGMLIGLVLSFVIPQIHGLATGPFMSNPILIHLQAGWRAVLGIVVGGGVIYLMGLLGEWIFKKEAMGGGDVKFMALIGAFMGWKLALLAFFIAPFFGAVYGLIEKIRTKDSAIAYGPFLALGALISLFWGEKIIEWIIHGYGLY